MFLLVFHSILANCPMDRMVGKSQSSIEIDCEKVSYGLGFRV